MQELRYDSYNQLLAIGSYNAEGELTHVSRYRYDSLGRRVAQTVQTYTDGKATGQEATYYGWDGDRLTTTKTRQGTTSTVYEPGSFTPLIQLYQADQSTKPARTEQEQIFRQIEITIAGIQRHLSPLDAQRQKEAVFAEAKRQLTADGKWQDLEDTNPLQIRYYHCNQIGTPLALSDEQGQVVWAAEYDPWGNVQKEYNADSKSIRQDIRLPGQHHDRTTELYYNRHRYYDPQLGAYVNQDPIGLNSGQPNLFAYVKDPIQSGDPLGRQMVVLTPAGPIPFPSIPAVILPPPEGWPAGIEYPVTDKPLCCFVEIPSSPPKIPPKNNCESKLDGCMKLMVGSAVIKFAGKSMCFLEYLICKKTFKDGD
ncbi:RHS repeat-associated core domain-containing protein [Lampropedia aestuarii]|uniref:RHS repeat-associated core domain-containing protein n=1 Tax=Lampropedia aestuarii TaxID=2562762 RepID=UPI002468B24D|nr:RHS repeat-associated core domain-containing protein [Lampropedia aestuarii]MDH5856533.1 RHS repeat-associated core domain-containing protein [Lampropedia aestuarii]